jgi:hypothetical protein
MVVCAVMWTCPISLQSGPMTTLGPMMHYGPTEVPSPITAPSSIRAVGSILLIAWSRISQVGYMECAGFSACYRGRLALSSDE